jgi:hypothetical protein
MLSNQPFFLEGDPERACLLLHGLVYAIQLLGEYLHNQGWSVRVSKVRYSLSIWPWLIPNATKTLVFAFCWASQSAHALSVNRILEELLTIIFPVTYTL